MISLHAHSSWSQKDSFGLPEQIVQRCVELGRKAVSITDHDNVFAHPFLQSSCVKAGVKPIFGCELRLVDNIKDNQRSKGHITVLAKNYEGYISLMKLVTSAWTEDCFYYFPTIDKKMLFECHEGLTVLSGCPSGTLSKKLLDKDVDGAISLVKEFKEVFGKDYYIEVMAHDLDLSIYIAPFLRAISKQMDLECVLTNDEHYLVAGQEKLQKILWCIRDRAQFKNHTMTPLPTLYYMTDDEIWAHMKKNIGEFFTDDELKRMLDNQERIASDCTVLVPKTEFLKYGVADPYAELASMAKDGLSIKGYGDNDEYIARLEKELDLVNRKNFSNYFLVVSDIVTWAKNNGILVGPSRGSSACSLLAHCVGITEVDPMRFDLPMERFMSEDRLDPPDIDVDFQDSRRQEVIDYMSARFNQSNVAQLATAVQFKGKNTLQELGKVFEIPPSDIKAVQNTLIYRGSGDARASATIEDTFKMFPVAQRVAEQYPEILNSIQLEGQIRHTSVHAAGLVVSNFPLVNSIAVMKKNGVNVAMLTGESHYMLGLLKMDILGLNYLSILKDLCDSTGMIAQDLYGMQLDDKEAISVFNSSTVGVFQFNAASTYSVGRQLGIDSFNDIVLATSLSRPGPLHCVSESMMIYDCEKEKMVTMKSAYKNGIKQTLSLYPDGSIKSANVKGIFNTGKQTVYSLKVKPQKHKCELFNILDKREYPSILASSEHRFLSTGKETGWRKLSDIIPGDTVQTSYMDMWTKNEENIEYEVDSIVPFGVVDTYDMEIEETHNYVVNGFITHNSGNTESITRAKRSGEIKSWEIALMNDITRNTYGYVVFQEQVIRIMREVGGMDWKDVTAIRSAMSRSLGDEYFDKFRGIFVEGSGKLWGLTSEYANMIFDHTSTFGSWAFNKAHAVGYSLISYWTAYFKAHYPREFYKVLCDHADSQERLREFLREYKEKGFGEILPPKIGKSQLGWTIDGNNLRAGLMTVIPEGAARVIDELSPVISLADLEARAPRRKVNSRIISIIEENEMFSDNDALDPFGLYAFAERLSYIPNRTKIGALGYNFDGRTVTIAGVLNQQINLKSITELKETQKLKDWQKRFSEEAGDEWCFPAGTKVVVSMESGNQFSGRKQVTKRVQDLRVGDTVISYNEKTSAKEIDTIVAISSRLARGLGDLKFDNGNKITATLEHPIYIVGKGWTKLEDVGVGDEALELQYPFLSHRLDGLNGERGKRRQSIDAREKCISAVVNSNKNREYSNELRETYSQTSKERWKDPKDGLNSKERSDKISAAVRKNMINYRKPNKMEIDFGNMLEIEFPGEWEYTGNGKVWFDNCNPDFVNKNGKKKIIEILGCYWHSCPDCYKLNEKDVEELERRKSIYAKYGFETLYLWEHEIKNSVVDRIKEFSFNPDIKIRRVVSKDIRKEQRMRVYNIQTNNNHNFFAHGILVHNCIIYIRDESGMVMNCHVKNTKYPKYKDMLWSKALGKDVLVLTGFVPGSTNYMIVNEIEEWNDNKAIDAKCYKCNLIRNEFCPPSGNNMAKMMFIGMCPGRDEVEIGTPFVGRAGQKLQEIMRELNIDRNEDVWITNATLCRPLKDGINRDPDEFELSCCKERVLTEIKRIHPKVIVTFGNVAYTALTGEVTRITEIAGTKIEFPDYTLIPTIHPAATLREDGAKYVPIIKDSLETALKVVSDVDSISNTHNLEGDLVREEA